MNVKSRLHLQTHTEPNGRAYLIGERKAFRELSNLLSKASQGILGVEKINFYTSDGHKFELFIACDVEEDEWQNLPVPYDKKHDPSKLNCVKTYDQIRKELNINH